MAAPTDRATTPCPSAEGPEQRFAELLDAAPDAMMIVDERGVITLANGQSQRLFGYAREELLGRRIETLIPERLRDAHLTHRKDYAAAPHTRPMGAGLELIGVRKNGSEFPVEISLSPVRGDAVLCAIRDTSDRRRIEGQLRASLREKEVLLKEVHHRVKNNLQVISSLLNFQAELITDEKARLMFHDTRARVKSIALIHERLYQSEDLTHIDFADYVRGLMDDMFDSYGVEHNRVALGIDIDNVLLDVDTLINCGLILGELASNALKYAFPDGRRGLVKVALKRLEQGRLLLSVTDDGVGLPASFLERPTLGLKLVRGLAKELGGVLEAHGDSGARFEITFKQP